MNTNKTLSQKRIATLRDTCDKIKIKNMNIYIQKLHSIPAPGKGCHTALLGVANCGLYAGFRKCKFLKIFDNTSPMEHATFLTVRFGLPSQKQKAITSLIEAYLKSHLENLLLPNQKFLQNIEIIC